MNTNIDKFLAGQISPFDRHQCDEASAADGWDAINVKIAARKAAQQAARKSRWAVRGLAAAACVVAVIVGAIMLKPTTQTKPTTAQQILPGRERAVLTLESGEQIVFDGTATNDEQRLSTLGITHNDATLDYSKGTAAVEEYVLYAPRGGIFGVTLADGTCVTLNSDTRLTYSGNFEGNERRVRVEGEAYFSVAKDPAKPFVVEAGGMTVRVLGTEFNILTREPGTAEATLIRGSVEVRAAGQTKTLSPGWQARLEQGEVTTAKVNAHLAMSWKEGMFEFNDMPLAAIAERLALWYDADFVFADPALRKIRFTGAFGKDNDLSYFLDLLARTQRVNHSIEGHTVTLTKR